MLDRRFSVITFGIAQVDVEPGVRMALGAEILHGLTHAILAALAIPLNRTALAVLEEIKASPTRHIKRVFTYRGKPLEDYGKAWFKSMDRAGLGEYKRWTDEEGNKHTSWTGFTWHGLRHTFASWLGQSGASEIVIDQLCGWAEKDTRSIYTHLNVESLRPYSEVIDRVLETNQPKGNQNNAAH